MKTFGLADKVAEALDNKPATSINNNAPATFVNDNAPVNHKVLDNTADEKKLIANGFKALLIVEEKSLKKLTSIHKWVMFLGILTIISLVAGLIAGIVALSSLR